VHRAIAVGLLCGYLAAPVRAQRPAYEELQTLSGAINHIYRNYADTVSYAALVRAAIGGMLHSLDPHSAYFARAEFSQRAALEQGLLATVGIEVDDVDGAMTVISVPPEAPAARAGVAAGDRLLAIDDTVIGGVPVGTVELRLAGREGSRVRLRLERGPRLEPDTFSVNLKRAVLEVRSVALARMVDSITLYVRLDRFGAAAGREVHDALNRFKGKGMRRAILDLRGNPGGYVVAAVELASEFLPRGTLVFRTHGRKSDMNEDYVTKRDGAFADLPLVVLIDEHSASAAEALAASLQDHDRALLVGRRSFGKALMQTDFLVLPAGDNLRLTVGWVISPSGRVIQRRYRGLAVEQYLGLAGTGGAAEDTARLYRTAAGRPVRGGGGIAPDVPLAPPRSLPVWFAVAADSGFIEAIADSVAATLAPSPAARGAWIAEQGGWRVRVLEPFLVRARARLRVSAETDTALDMRLARILAARVADVRWGRDASAELLLATSPEVQASLALFPRLGELLSPPRE
jgi:carboxyl-terminal processing protease